MQFGRKGNIVNQREKNGKNLVVVNFMWQLSWAMCLDNWLNIILNGNESSSVMSNSLQLHGLHCSWNSPDQNTVVGSLSLLQEISIIQESNSGLLHCRQIRYLNHKRSPRILQWVAYPFSSRSSQPRKQTGVSCIAGGFFTNWAIRKEEKWKAKEKRKDIPIWIQSSKE